MAKRTIKSILRMDISEFSRMGKKELSSIVTQMASAANKRVKGLVERQNKTSPAYRGAEKTRSPEQEKRGKLFGLGRGKHTMSEVRKEFARLRNFMQSPASTSAGYEKQLGKTVDDLQKMWGLDITVGEAKNIFSEYDKMKERFPQLGERAFKYDLAKMIAEGGQMPETAEDVNNIMSRLREQYEQRERDYQGGISDLL